jgi:hypothetical protein
MVMPVFAPSWLLLGWAAAAATCAAAFTGSLLGGRAPWPWALSPRPRSPARAVLGTAAAGLVFYPLVYGLVFELLGRSDVLVGTVAGVVHALVAAAAAAASASPNPGSAALRLGLAHLVYAVVMGFLYVTP